MDLFYTYFTRWIYNPWNHQIETNYKLMIQNVIISRAQLDKYFQFNTNKWPLTPKIDRVTRPFLKFDMRHGA